MRKRRLLLIGLACTVALVFAGQVHGDAAEEVKRLAELMGWKAGTVAADIGAGDGRFTFAAGGRVGGGGEKYGAGIYNKKMGGLERGNPRREGRDAGGGGSKKAGTKIPAPR